MSNCVPYTVDLITLNCLVLGNDTSRIFQIKIAPTATISILRDVIKEKKKPEFDTFAADRFELWQLDKLSFNNAFRLQLRDEDKISWWPMLKLSKFFSNLNDERLYVIIQRPPAAVDPIELRCFVLGDDSNRIFPITIAPTADVCVLRDMIKEKKKPEFDTIVADRLKLWHVSLPASDTLERMVRHHIEHMLPLSPLTKLSKLFPTLPEEERLHIVIQLPPSKTPLSAGTQSPFKFVDEREEPEAPQCQQQ